MTGCTSKLVFFPASTRKLSLGSKVLEGQSMRKVLEGQGMREVLEGQGTSVFVPQPGSWSLTSQGVFRETAMCLDHVLLEVTR